MVTLADLGILRDVQVLWTGRTDGIQVVVTITPTYSGCPAMDEITSDVRTVLAGVGCTDVDVRIVLAPAWTTDWMTDAGRQKLLDFGIAPPRARDDGPVAVSIGHRRPSPVPYPQCGSTRTEELTRFGSTACKAMWRCLSCREPFDHFKNH